MWRTWPRLALVLVLVLGFALASPHLVSAQAGSPTGLIEWSATIGDWYTNAESGVLQISAGRSRYEEPRQELALTWLRWDPDKQVYIVATSLESVEICGATAFYETALMLFDDASPEFTDVVLQIRFLAEEPGTGKLRTLFMMVDKSRRTFRVLNCR
jgi:hypothetical protein